MSASIRAAFFVTSFSVEFLSSSAAPLRKRSKMSAPNARLRIAPPTADVEE